MAMVRGNLHLERKCDLDGLVKALVVPYYSGVGGSS